MAAGQRRPFRRQPPRELRSWPPHNWPEYNAAHRLIGMGLPTQSRDPIDEELCLVAPRLFEAITQFSKLILDHREPEDRRRRLLDDLKAAARRLSPQGRPPAIDELDVAHDWKAVARMHEEFVELMKELEDGELGTASAAVAVACIRAAEAGDRDALALVNQRMPSWTQNPLWLRPDDREELLRRLEKIRRPRSDVTFASLLLSVKYRCSAGTIQKAIRELKKRAARRRPTQPVAGMPLADYEALPPLEPAARRKRPK